MGVRLPRLIRAAVHLTPFAMMAFIAMEWNGIPGQARDSLAYHEAAEAARSGTGIYEPVPGGGPHEFTGRWYYIYPPPLAALLSLAPRSSYRTFDRGWLLVNLLAFWTLAASLGKISSRRWTWEGTARWGAALFFLPGTLLAMHFGNIDLIILALVGLGLALPASFAGGLLGLAAAFKVSPVWPLLMLGLRRPRDVISGMMAAFTICAGACILVFGVVETPLLAHFWLKEVMPAVTQGQFWGESLARLQEGGLGPQHYFANLSISFLPVQLGALSGWWGYDGGPLSAAVQAYLTAVAIGAPLLVGWITRKRDPRVQASAVLAAAMLGAPIVRPYVLPVILLVVAAVQGTRQADRQKDQRVARSGPMVVGTTRI